MGLLLLTLIISGLALQIWLLIEIQLNGIAFNGIAFVKFDRIVNPIKNTILTKSNNFHLHYVIFFIKYLGMSTISSTSVTS